jgi:hypothetical protein
MNAEGQKILQTDNVIFSTYQNSGDTYYFGSFNMGAQVT